MTWFCCRWRGWNSKTPYRQIFRVLRQGLTKLQMSLEIKLRLWDREIKRWYLRSHVIRPQFKSQKLRTKTCSVGNSLNSTWIRRSCFRKILVKPIRICLFPSNIFHSLSWWRKNSQVLKSPAAINLSLICKLWGKNPKTQYMPGSFHKNLWKMSWKLLKYNTPLSRRLLSNFSDHRKMMLVLLAARVSG